MKYRIDVDAREGGEIEARVIALGRGDLGGPIRSGTLSLSRVVARCARRIELDRDRRAREELVR